MSFRSKEGAAVLYAPDMLTYAVLTPVLDCASSTFSDYVAREYHPSHAAPASVAICHVSQQCCSHDQHGHYSTSFSLLYASSLQKFNLDILNRLERLKNLELMSEV